VYKAEKENHVEKADENQDGKGVKPSIRKHDKFPGSRNDN